MSKTEIENKDLAQQSNKAVEQNNDIYLEIKKAFDVKYFPNGCKRGCYRPFIKKQILKALEISPIQK